jgi:hypothetical protein
VPEIGHLKDGHRMGRNDLAGRTGDAVNAVLAAVGYNFRFLLVGCQDFGGCFARLFAASARLHPTYVTIQDQITSQTTIYDPTPTTMCSSATICRRRIGYNNCNQPVL